MPEALPSLRTVKRSNSKEYSSFTEGFFNFDGLLLHIKDHKTSKAISVGEDATPVVTRIDYDCETDRCGVCFSFRQQWSSINRLFFSCFIQSYQRNV